MRHIASIIVTRSATYLIAALGVLIFCGLGNADASNPSVRGGATMLDGTPIAGGVIVLLDSAGRTAAVRSNAAGKFKFDAAGMTPPFLLSATDAAGAVLYGVALKPGLADIDVYTDLILNLIYGAEGSMVGAQFDTSAPMIPTGEQLELAGSLVQNAINIWLQNNRVKFASFNFFTGRFSASPHRFGEVLRETRITSPFANDTETITIASGANNEVITFSADPAAIEATANGTVTFGSKTSAFMLHTNLPSPQESSLIDGINATLAQLQAVVAAKKKKLAATDAAAFFDSRYLRGGEDVTVGSAQLVTDLRNLTKVRDFTVSRLTSVLPDPYLPATLSDVDVVWQLSFGKDALRTFSEDFRCPTTGGSCTFWGNQQIAQTNVAIATLTTSSLTGNQTAQYLDVETLAPNTPLPLLESALVEDSGEYFPVPTPLPLAASQAEQIFYPTESSLLLWTEQDFYQLINASERAPALGAAFQFMLTPVNGSEVTYTTELAATSGEPVALTEPALTGSHAINAAPLGKTLTIKWHLPQSYAVQGVSLGGEVANAGCDTVEQIQPRKPIKPSSTSAKLKLPKLMADGSAIAFVQFDLGIAGESGGMSHLTYKYGDCTPS